MDGDVPGRRGPRPAEDRPTQLSVRVPTSLKVWVLAEARRRGITVSDLVRAVLERLRADTGEEAGSGHDQRV